MESRLFSIQGAHTPSSVGLHHPRALIQHLEASTAYLSRTASQLTFGSPLTLSRCDYKRDAIFATKKAILKRWRPRPNSPSATPAGSHPNRPPITVPACLPFPKPFLREGTQSGQNTPKHRAPCAAICCSFGVVAAIVAAANTADNDLLAALGVLVVLELLHTS
jgi:hypothetical protein